MSTERQADLFRDKILPPVGKVTSNGRRPEGNLSGFLAQQGRRYPSEGHGLMVVGRAVNGWGDCTDPVEFNDDQYRNEYTYGILEGSFPQVGKPCPMEWVTKYRRSAFWAVIEGVAKGLGISNPGSEDWPSHLVWSNLYKVSPANGGNPDNALCNAQYDGCKELFQCEIRDYRPRYLLFLTETRKYPDWWARPFLDNLELCDWPKMQHVRFTGRLSFPGCSRGTLIAGAVHPQGQPGPRQKIGNFSITPCRLHFYSTPRSRRGSPWRARGARMRAPYSWTRIQRHFRLTLTYAAVGDRHGELLPGAWPAAGHSGAGG